MVQVESCPMFNISRGEKVFEVNENFFYMENVKKAMEE